jgi:GNAT superfamily N-acetyltransferase
MSVIQDKIVNRIRQFGIGPSLVQIVQAGVRYIYVSNRNIVFVIRDFLSSTFEDSAIVPMTKERIERALVEGVLNERPVRLLTAFLEEGSRGLCAEIDGHLAGYAWIQFGGRYVFGRNGKLEIPPKYAIVKNLWVSPEFRGQKIGQKLNAARLALVPAGIPRWYSLFQRIDMSFGIGSDMDFSGF